MSPPDLSPDTDASPATLTRGKENDWSAEADMSVVDIVKAESTLTTTVI
jgi:hypothetical protein